MNESRVHAPADPAARWELTRWPPIRSLLRQRSLNWALATVALVVFLLAIAAGLWGTPAGSANFGIVFVWIVWWGLLMGVLLPLGGRLWCLVCPIPAPGEWLQRAALVDPPGRRLPEDVFPIGQEPPPHRPPFPLGWRWPRALRGIWLQNASFLLVALFSTLILTRPAVTAWLLILFLAAGIGLALVFERRTFCRYVCPVGGFIGLYSLVAPVELRIRDPRICEAHKTKACYLGNGGGYGCPWLEQPWKMDRNAYCGLCGECLRTCTEDNLRLSLRLPGADLLVARGWRADEAYKAFIMLACAAIYPAVFLGPWGRLKAWADLQGLAGFALYAAAFLALNLVAVPALHLGAAALTRRLSRLTDMPLERLFVALAYPLVPLGLAAWMVFTLTLVFANLSYVLPVLSDPFGWGWNLLGMRGAAWHPWLSNWVPPIQMVLLIAGLIGAIATADAILRKLPAEKAGIGALAIQACLFTGETLLLLWLYLGAST